MAKRKSSSRQVTDLLRAITGRTVADGQYVGKKVYGRKGTAFAAVAGLVTGTSACRLEGCRGTRLHVKWPDGKRTYPCAKGCTTRDDGDLEIG